MNAATTNNGTAERGQNHASLPGGLRLASTTPRPPSSSFLDAIEDLPFWCALFALLLGGWFTALAVFLLALAYRAAVRWAVSA